MIDARVVAARVLRRVAEEGAFAALALDAELARANLPARDAALATALVYGTLRTLPSVDAIIDAKRARGGKLDAIARAALRVAVFQLRGLDRVPSYAAVDAAVSLVRKERGPRVAGFVNAVLRRIAAEGAPRLADGLVVPPWLADALRASVGPERATRFLSDRPMPPALDLRIVDGRVDRDVLVSRIAALGEDVIAEPTGISSVGVRVLGGGDPRKLPGFDDGAFVVQEEGSQVIGRMLGARPGETVLDACAGRGGKTLQLLEAVGADGRVVAMDVHEGRLAQLRAAAARLGLPARVETETIDLTVGTGGLDPVFDRVLVDAPCTGLGTVHRRPEILLRLGPDDPKRLAETQRAILRNAASLVRPGGVLVYSVCSPLAEEGAAVTASLTGFRPLAFDPEVLAGLASDADAVLRLGPWVESPHGGTDAYQVLRFERLA